MANRTYRAKKIDYSKGLPVHLSTDIADFEENVFAIRSVPQVSTGVEKEEEEHETNSDKAPVFAKTEYNDEILHIAVDYTSLLKSQKTAANR